MSTCPYCRGDEDLHPWPEEGPYWHGCIETLRKQREEFERELLDAILHGRLEEFARRLNLPTGEAPEKK